MLRSMNQNFTDKQLKKIVASFDHNGDGQIDFSEFLGLMSDHVGSLPPPSSSSPPLLRLSLPSLLLLFWHLLFRHPPSLTPTLPPDLPRLLGLSRSALPCSLTHIIPTHSQEDGKEEVDELAEAFSVFDKDGDGTISSTELSMVMKALGENLPIETVELMIQSVDTNGDGDIDFQEFKKMMQDGPPVISHV